MDNSSANAAFIFVAANYDTSQESLVGRQVASEEFLRGFARHSGVEHMFCYTQTQPDFEEFTRRIETYVGAPRPTTWIRPTELSAVGPIGTLFSPGPDIGHYAWLRRHFDQRGFSLCGITHTTADNFAMDALGGLMTAPLQQWDALVCTSQAVKDMVARLLDRWGEYLEERFGAPVRRQFELPVIPLGVDCDRFTDDSLAHFARKEIRARHGIAEDDIAVLYMGRLSHADKVNPLPLYMALEEAAKGSDRRFHFIQAGWFPNRYTEDAFRAAAAALAPSVNNVLVDGRVPETRQGIWFAADIFASTPDSIQETFGLTPLEAMAAGLAVVVSDWDGYRETVRDGIDGITVPTLMPGAGAGADLAYYFAGDVTDYQGYALATSQSIAVDVAALAAAFTRLAGDADLRRRMGEAGRKRARESFDWRVVVAAYQALWQELEERRRGADEIVQRRSGRPAYPLRDDPYALFETYPSVRIVPSSRVSAVPEADPGRLRALRGIIIANPLPAVLLAEEEILAVFAKVADGGCAVGALMEGLSPDKHAALFRTIGWLAKIGLVRVDGGAAPP